jgi:hypothetical protein
MTELARRFRIDGGSFGPADPVATEQFFKNAIRGGEERLMLAVLQDAVKCFQENVLAQYLWEKKLFQEAEDWILETNSDWLFSFESICEALQLKPDYIRRGLLSWKKAQRKIGTLSGNSIVLAATSHRQASRDCKNSFVHGARCSRGHLAATKQSKTNRGRRIIQVSACFRGRSS